MILFLEAPGTEVKKEHVWERCSLLTLTVMWAGSALGAPGRSLNLHAVRSCAPGGSEHQFLEFYSSSVKVLEFVV